jgi:hemolysin activation/secretion protein
MEHLRFPDEVARRFMTDLRGYVGVGPIVVGIRAQSITSDSPLPASEQPLLGGGDTLRGYRAGHRVGDNLAALSTEVRLPINSPLSVGRFGVKTFVDWGTTWASGARLADQRWDRGVGGGIYFGGGPGHRRPRDRLAGARKPTHDLRARSQLLSPLRPSA